jgi:hypothetical protein
MHVHMASLIRAEFPSYRIHAPSLQQMGSPRPNARPIRSSTASTAGQGNNQGTNFIDFSDMGWGNEGFNQITTDVQSADEHSPIAAGSTEFQHPAQNLHGLLPPYRVGSEHVPGAVPVESSAYYSTTVVDVAHQSSEFLPAQSHFGDFPNEQQSASAAVCTQPQHLSNQQVPPTFIDLQCDTFQNQQSIAHLDRRLQSNVFSLEQPQFCLNDTFHNHLQSSAFSALGDSPHIFDDQQSLAPLDSQLQSGVLPAQSQSGLGNLPYIFDDQQSLHNQPQSSVFALAQPQAVLGDFPHIFDDQQFLHNQPQSSVFALAQPQAVLGDSPHIFDDQQSLHNQPQSGVYALAQPQAGLGDSSHIFEDQQSLQAGLGDSLHIFEDQQSLHNQPQSSAFSGLGDSPHIFDDQQYLAPFASQLQSGSFPAQSQFSAAFINSGSNILSSPTQFPNEQSSSIVIPLNPASAEYHNTSTALAIQDPRGLSRQTSCIGCRVQKIKVFALPLRQETDILTLF